MSGSSNSGLFGIDTRRWTGLWDVQQDRRKTEHVTSRNSNRKGWWRKKTKRSQAPQCTGNFTSCEICLSSRCHRMKKKKSWVCLELRATSHEHSRLVWLTVYSVRVNVLLSAVFLSVKMVKHTQIIYITKTEVTPFYYKYTICITKEYLELGITNMFVFQGRYRFLAIKEIDDQYLKVSAKYNLFKILFTWIFLLLYILPLNDNILLSTPLHVLVTLVCLQI